MVARRLRLHWSALSVSFGLGDPGKGGHGWHRWLNRCDSQIVQSHCTQGIVSQELIVIIVVVVVLMVLMMVWQWLLMVPRNGNRIWHHYCVMMLIEWDVLQLIPVDCCHLSTFDLWLFRWWLVSVDCMTGKWMVNQQIPGCLGTLLMNKCYVDGSRWLPIYFDSMPVINKWLCIHNPAWRLFCDKEVICTEDIVKWKQAEHGRVKMNQWDESVATEWFCGSCSKLLVPSACWLQLVILGISWVPVLGPGFWEKDQGDPSFSWRF